MGRRMSSSQRHHLVLNVEGEDREIGSVIDRGPSGLAIVWRTGVRFESTNDRIMEYRCSVHPSERSVRKGITITVTRRGEERGTMKDAQFVCNFGPESAALIGGRRIQNLLPEKYRPKLRAKSVRAPLNQKYALTSTMMTFFVVAGLNYDEKQLKGLGYNITSLSFQRFKLLVISCTMPLMAYRAGTFAFVATSPTVRNGVQDAGDLVEDAQPLSVREIDDLIRSMIKSFADDFARWSDSIRKVKERSLNKEKMYIFSPDPIDFERKHIFLRPDEQFEKLRHVDGSWRAVARGTDAKSFNEQRNAVNEFIRMHSSKLG